MRAHKGNFGFTSFLLVAGILLYWISLPVSGAIPPQERAALVALYNSTTGDNWSNNSGWKTPPLDVDGFALPGTENTWYGITCDSGNTTVQKIYMYGNNLDGAIPPELANLANLRVLYLCLSQLSGSIPPELANLANLRVLYLCLNQLSGSIPSNLTNLTKLERNRLDLRWNALYTNDDTLRIFLNSKQNGGNWESTQTTAPLDVAATSASNSSLDISWTPIIYTSNTGGYRVYYSTTPGRPYTYFDMTADKTGYFLTVIGLNPGTTYYFVVQTRTDPPAMNQNTVDSEYSAEVAAETLPGTFTISGTITSVGSGLPGITLTLSNGGGTEVTDAKGNYSVTVNYGWTGTATPSKIGYIFSPAGRAYKNGTTDQANQDYTAELQTFTISGTVTYEGSGLPGVTIALSNNGGTVVTDVNGYYSVTINYGWTGTITPARDYYLFNPANRDYPLVTSNIKNQDYTASIPLSLTIRAARQNERAFLINKDFGIITLTVENSQYIPGIRFVIYRKTSTSEYQPIKELTAAELQSGIYIYYDKYIDKNITYTYRVTAYDPAGNIMVVSNEENI